MAAAPKDADEGATEPDDDGTKAREEEQAAIESIIAKIIKLEPTDPLI